jgi:tetratricopeptide (TPR) repeat protein
LAETKAKTSRFIEAEGDVFQAYFTGNRGETNMMFAWLKKAATLNPNNILLHENFDSLRKEAFNLSEAGQIEGATALYRRMIDILPKDAKSHYNLAMMLKRRGDMDGAMGHFQEAARLDPGYALAFFQIGEIYVEKGSAREAQSQYRRALQIKPDFVPAINNLARLMIQHTGQAVQNVPEAIRLAEKGRQLTQSRNPIMLNTLAEAYAASGRYAEARAIAIEELDLVNAGGNKSSADQIRRRIEIYESRSGRPGR